MSSSHPYPTTVFDTTVMHLNGDAQETLAYGIVAAGASFAVVGAEQAVLRVIYQNPIILKLMDEMSEEPDFQDCLCFDGTLMKEPPEVLIDTDIRNAYKPRFRRSPNRGIKNRASKLTHTFFCATALILIGSAILLFTTGDGPYLVSRCIFVAVAGLFCAYGPLLYFWFRERDYRAWLRSYKDISRMRRNLSW